MLKLESTGDVLVLFVSRPAEGFDPLVVVFGKIPFNCSSRQDLVSSYSVNTIRREFCYGAIAAISSSSASSSRKSFAATVSVGGGASSAEGALRSSTFTLPAAGDASSKCR